jgi:hypothetical protein
MVIVQDRLAILQDSRYSRLPRGDFSANAGRDEDIEARSGKVVTCFLLANKRKSGRAGRSCSIKNLKRDGD